MSHTSTIDSVRIVDINALRAALRELSTKHGVPCELVENATPRAYFPDQAGLGHAPYVIRLNNCQYDVGLYPHEDGRGFSARTDLWMGYVSDQLGAQTRKGESAEQGALGKLFNLYGVHAAMRVAARNGQSVRRIDKEDGSVQLVVNLAA
jgi:hypothetical protein